MAHDLYSGIWFVLLLNTCCSHLLWTTHHCDPSTGYLALQEHNLVMSAKPFPASKGMLSFWRTTTGSLDNHRSTEALPSDCDILIIGAGYSGGSLLTHLQAQEESKGKSILVLEARQLCSGATGRNGTVISLH